MSNQDKKKYTHYCFNFERHIQAFMNEYQLIHKHKKMILSVSGGVDSLSLAEIFYQLKISFELLHFNHGTRPKENSAEEALVSDFAKRHGLFLHTIHLNLSLKEKNFEKKARDQRQKSYREFIDNGYWVYTAHHVDDSFEWSLMQSFKQSSLKSKLGIPVFNSGIARPFMCVTKKQIRRYAHKKNLIWLEDSSNENLSFERNFLRHHLTSIILKKYPKALAHYVAQSNELVKMQKLLHRELRPHLQIKNEIAGVVLVAENLGVHTEEIKKAILKFSNKERGLIAHEVQKLIKSHDEIKKSPEKFPFKGPMNFSGGVSAYLMKDNLLITGATERAFYQKLDARIVKHLEGTSQIPGRLMIEQFPYLVITSEKNPKKSSKFIHPLLPVTCLWLKNHGISYTFTPLLGPTDRQKLAFDAVILDSSVLGL